MSDDHGRYGIGGGAMSLMPGDVRDYLLEHPDFLQSHDDLLAAMLPPSHRRGDSVEDFQRFMLAKLQNHYRSIKGEHDDLLDLMQDYMQRQNRVNAAVMSLVDAPSFAALISAATEGLAIQMEQQAVGLFIETADDIRVGNYGGLRVVPIGFVDRWMQGQEVILEEKRGDASSLYGARDRRVESHALVRLSISNVLPPGLLALGHDDSLHYATGLATDQILFLGSVVERCFRTWLITP